MGMASLLGVELAVTLRGLAAFQGLYEGLVGS